MAQVLSQDHRFGLLDGVPEGKDPDDVPVVLPTPAWVGLKIWAPPNSISIPKLIFLNGSTHDTRT